MDGGLFRRGAGFLFAASGMESEDFVLYDGNADTALLTDFGHPQGNAKEGKEDFRS